MNSKTNQLLLDLNEQLNFIDLEIDDTIKRCEKAIKITIKSVQKLKTLFLKENTVVSHKVCNQKQKQLTSNS